jgi:hypothetical protein
MASVFVGADRPVHGTALWPRCCGETCGGIYRMPEKYWSEWQDLNLRPLVPNEVAWIAPLEFSAFFGAFENECSRFRPLNLWRACGSDPYH